MHVQTCVCMALPRFVMDGSAGRARPDVPSSSGNLSFAELALIWRLITRQDLHQRLIPAAYWDQLALRGASYDQLGTCCLLTLPGECSAYMKTYAHLP